MAGQGQRGLKVLAGGIEERVVGVGGRHAGSPMEKLHFKVSFI